MDDSQIDSYTNGGTLTTLVWNNDTQEIYLVDHDTKYWFQQYCSAWGLSCLNQVAGAVTFMTSDYFDDIINYGGTSQPLQQDNGSIYLMQNGKKEPFANTASLLAAGYNGSDILPINQSDLNSTQALGNLQISTPGFIQFPPSSKLFYFDGQNYWYVPSYQIYEDWGSPPIMNPATSADNTTPPTTSGNLSDWVTDGSGNYYLIDSGNKINVTSDPTTWYSGTYQTLGTADLSTLQTVNQEPNVNIGGSIYVVQNATLRHVPTYNNYLWLGINGSNTLNLSPGAYNNIPSGVDILSDGSAFTVSGNPGLYIVSGNVSYHMPSTAMVNDFGIDWRSIIYNLNPNVLSSGYPSTSDLSRWVVAGAGNNMSYIANRVQVTIGSQAAANWGISQSTENPIHVGLATVYGVNQVQTLGQFVQDETTGKVYYASGGTYHFVASYNTFLSLGGNTANLTRVYPDFFSGLTQGSTLN